MIEGEIAMPESTETSMEDGSAVIGSAPDHLVGSWSPEDVQEVVHAIRSCGKTDEEPWSLVIR